jgi:DNA-binding LytR/AlgR family response regulator
MFEALCQRMLGQNIHQEDPAMKVLIASSNIEASRHINKTVGQIAPIATYLHADSAERVLELFGHHRIDLVLLDLQLVAKDSAAATLLRMLNPGALAFVPLEKQLRSVASTHRPGLLMTFDGDEIQGEAESVVSRLEGATRQTVERVHGANGPTIWAQSQAGDWRTVGVDGLQWAVSEQGKVRLHHRSQETYFVRDRLKELERQLGPSHFMRIHKSYLVNSAHVAEVERWSSGSLLLKIKGPEKTRLPVSRRYASSFRKQTGWGIGPVCARA